MLPGARSVTPANCDALEAEWGFPVPRHVGHTAPEMIEAAERDELDVLYVSGGNFLVVLPDPPRVAAAMQRVPLRVHQDVVVTSQMFVPPADGGEVILLPTATRYEQEGGGTETTTERRIIFSPHIDGHQVGEARSEWRIFGDVAARVRPDLAGHFGWPTNQALRQEIARVVPFYAGIETLATTGDSVQWGGRHLVADGVFPTPDGRARFSVVASNAPEIPDGHFVVSTRRGKQFNSMVHSNVDPLNGARRDDVLIDPSDAATLGLLEGAAVTLTSTTGSLRGRLKFARLPVGSVQVHWPEGNVLIASGSDHREPRSNVPDYNAVITITPVQAEGGRT
jgi:predicted molibdopterin-dependent oxidoreductase YjgC